MGDRALRLGRRRHQPGQKGDRGRSSVIDALCLCCAQSKSICRDVARGAGAPVCTQGLEEWTALVDWAHRIVGFHNPARILEWKEIRQGGCSDRSCHGARGDHGPTRSRFLQRSNESD